MNNQEKIEAINKWQSCNFVHPLTCGKDKCEEKLEPIENAITGEILLICPKCNYEQGEISIPSVVFHFNYEQFNKIEAWIDNISTQVDENTNRDNQ